MRKKRNKKPRHAPPAAPVEPRRDTQASPPLPSPPSSLSAAALFAWRAGRALEHIKRGNLVHITYGYLALPMLLFLFGWLHWYYALPAAALLVALLLQWGGQCQAQVRPGGTSLLVCGIVALLWTALSGAGGFGFQNFDYIKHNAVLRALSRNDWPVALGVDASLVFTVGYYLPAAALGKVFGWAATNLAMFFWTAAGVWLALLWFTRLAGGRAVWCAPLFVVIGGMDLIPYWLYREFGLPEVTRYTLDRSADLFEFSSMSTLLYWVPHHALAGWLGAALFLQLKDEDAFYRHSLLLGACLALWSFFSALGVALVILAYFALYPRRILAALIILPQLGGAAFVAVVALYITSSNFTIEHGWFIGKVLSADGWHRYVVILLTKFAIVGFCAARIARPEQRRLLIAMCVLLALIPLYQIGFGHDMAMRTSIPALFIFWRLVFEAAFARRPPRRGADPLVAYPRVIAICLAFGAVTALYETARSLSRYPRPLPPLEQALTVARIPPYSVAARQYIGHRESLLFRYLSPSTVNESNPDLLHQSAAIHMKERRFEEALALLDRTLEAEPKNPQVLYDKAAVLTWLQRATEADQIYRDLQTRRPDFLDYMVGEPLRLGHPEDTLEFHLWRTTVEPDNAHTHYLLGLGLWRTGMLRQAAASWQKTLALEPGHNAARAYLQGVMRQLEPSG